MAHGTSRRRADALKTKRAAGAQEKTNGRMQPTHSSVNAAVFSETQQGPLLRMRAWLASRRANGSYCSLNKRVLTSPISCCIGLGAPARRIDHQPWRIERPAPALAGLLPATPTERRRSARVAAEPAAGMRARQASINIVNTNHSR